MKNPKPIEPPKTHHVSEDLASKVKAGNDVTIKECLAAWQEWMLEYSSLEETTAHTYYVAISGWLRDAGYLARRVTVFDERMFHQFVNDDSSAGVSTRKLRLATVKNLCNFAYGKGWLPRDPSRLVKVRMRKLSHSQKETLVRDPFSHSEYQHVVRAFRDFAVHARGVDIRRIPRMTFWYHAVELSYWTGLRFSDVCNLEWSCLSGEELVVWTDKRDKRVALPLMHPLLGQGAILDVFVSVQVKHERFLFPEVREIARTPAKKHLFPTDFGRQMKRLGLPSKTFHGLRHSFVTRLSEAGESLESIGKLVGHSSTKTTAVYNHAK